MFKLSSEASLDGAITVENKFIVEYMPYADGDYVKVYLYALSLAMRKQDGDDSIARLARRLDLDAATVDAAIEYWSEQGLMSRLGDDICFFSPRTARPKIKKFDVDKYGEFNRQAQNFISGRQISPNEFGEYYTLMEKFNLEWQAMALIVRYCVNLKGENVSCPYIVTVARNLAEDGYRTESEVGERLDEYGVYYNDLCVVLGAMGGKRPDHEAVKLYKKWKIEFKFEPDVILHAAQGIKRGGAAALDAKLTHYRELNLATIEQIDGYEDGRRKTYKLAKAVNKALGLYYDNVDPEIATYITPWLDMGFEDGAILAAADYCMKKDMKRLSDLDAVIRDFFSRSLTTESDIKTDLDRESRYDGEIEKLLKSLGIPGAVKDAHRAYYSNWSEKWKMPHDAIEHAATLAVGKDNPFAYMNSILRAWRDGGVDTAEKAKATVAPANATDKQPSSVVYEQYSADELNALFTKITEED